MYDPRLKRIKKKKDESVHHLFSYFEIRRAVVDIFGDPKSEEEHLDLHKKIKDAFKQMPLYVIKKEHHSQIHTKRKSQIGKLQHEEQI